jgi:hypothetical protein
VRELLPWLPTVAGVGALIVLLIIAATRFTSSPEVSAVPPPQPFLPAPAESPVRTAPAESPAELPAVPGASAGTPGASPSVTRQVRPATHPTSPRPTRATTAPTTAPTRSPVTGRYRVVDSYADAFIGEVLVANSSGTDRDWRVELRFPPAVGELITSWVESAPQATLRRSGNTYVWTSGAPVAAHAEVALRFHFHRSGSGDLPSSCTVGGSACTGVR